MALDKGSASEIPDFSDFSFDSLFPGSDDDSKSTEGEQESETTVKNDWMSRSIVSITEDNMEAHLMLWPLSEEDHVSLEDVIAFLRTKQVKYGILEDEIQKMLDDEIYLVETCVAKGTKPVQGKDGYFEMFIEKTKDKKPRILPDGSVDYSDYDAITVVEKDQLLARYHAGLKGEDGKNIKGENVVANKGQELRPYTGKGFYTNEDKTEYYATFSGRADFTDNSLIVTHVLDVNEDVDYRYGNIDFAGDVHIKGDVLSGMYIRTTGFITVEGHVEDAELTAAKGVILKNGMQGSGRGKIRTDGDVEGKFFEQTIIECGGNVHANTILSCDITAKGSVTVEGTLGALVGGVTRSRMKVEAAYIGNIGNVKTEIMVGTKGDPLVLLKTLDDQLKKATKDLYTAEGKKKVLEDAVARGITDPRIAVLQKAVMRDRINLNSEIMEIKNRKNELAEFIQNAKTACVVAEMQAYPGTVITVNGAKMKIPDVVNGVTIKVLNGKAVMERI